MEILKRIDAWLEVVEKTLVTLIFSGLIILIVLNIIARNLFQVSFQSVFELAPGMVLWLALIGAGMALKHWKHIKIELLFRYTPPRFVYIARIVQFTFGACLMGLLFIASLTFVRNEIEIFGSRGWLAVIFPIFFTVACFRFLTKIFYQLSKSVGGNDNDRLTPSRNPSREAP